MTTNLPRSIRHRGVRIARQSGVVLIMALIFLVLITILAISASGSSLLQQKMVSATRNAQIAEFAANSALRGVEWKLFSLSRAVGTHLVCTTDIASSPDRCERYSSRNPDQQPGGTVYRFKNEPTWAGAAALGLAYSNPRFMFTNPAAGFGNSVYNSTRIANPPRYIIEDMGPVRPPQATVVQETGTTGLRAGGSNKIRVDTYRITVRSPGQSNSVLRVVQSTFDAQTHN